MKRHYRLASAHLAVVPFAIVFLPGVAAADPPWANPTRAAPCGLGREDDENRKGLQHLSLHRGRSARRGVVRLIRAPIC
jgi:hypothetical protein